MFTITTDDPRVEYEKETKCFMVYMERRWPNILELVSHKTGVIEVFELNENEAMQNEFWDGECNVLRPRNKSLNCRVVITYKKGAW